VAELAQLFRADLGSCDLQPDVFVGWSMGGQLGYELIAELPDPKPALVILDSMPPTGGYSAVPAGELARQAFTIFASALGVTGRLPVPDTHGDLELAVHSLAALLSASGEPITGALLTRRWQTYLRHAGAVHGYRRDDPLDTSALVVAADLADDQVTAWSERLPQARTARVEADHHGLLRGAAAGEVAARIVELAAAIGFSGKGIDA